MACPHCRRKVRLSLNSATVAVVSPFSATVALFCDSVDRALHNSKSGRFYKRHQPIPHRLYNGKRSLSTLPRCPVDVLLLFIIFSSKNVLSLRILIRLMENLVHFPLACKYYSCSNYAGTAPYTRSWRWLVGVYEANEGWAELMWCGHGIMLLSTEDSHSALHWMHSFYLAIRCSSK